MGCGGHMGYDGRLRWVGALARAGGRVRVGGRGWVGGPAMVGARGWVGGRVRFCGRGLPFLTDFRSTVKIINFLTENQTFVIPTPSLRHSRLLSVIPTPSLRHSRLDRESQMRDHVEDDGRGQELWPRLKTPPWFEEGCNTPRHISAVSCHGAHPGSAPRRFQRGSGARWGVLARTASRRCALQGLQRPIALARWVANGGTATVFASFCVAVGGAVGCHQRHRVHFEAFFSRGAFPTVHTWADFPRFQPRCAPEQHT